MLKTLQTIKNEKVINIKELQKSPSRYLKNITRILRGNETLGYFLDQEAFENLIEDLQALSSPTYIKKIKKARSAKKAYSLKEVEKRYGL